MEGPGQERILFTEFSLEQKIQEGFFVLGILQGNYNTGVKFRFSDFICNTWWLSMSKLPRVFFILWACRFVPFHYTNRRAIRSSGVKALHCFTLVTAGFDELNRRSHRRSATATPLLLSLTQSWTSHIK